jgi:hypothetical protein
LFHFEGFPVGSIATTYTEADRLDLYRFFGVGPNSIVGDYFRQYISSNSIDYHQTRQKEIITCDSFTSWLAESSLQEKMPFLPFHEQLLYPLYFRPLTIQTLKKFSGAVSTLSAPEGKSWTPEAATASLPYTESMHATGIHTLLFTSYYYSPLLLKNAIRQGFHSDQNLAPFEAFLHPLLLSPNMSAGSSTSNILNNMFGFVYATSSNRTKRGISTTNSKEFSSVRYICLISFFESTHLLTLIL